MFLRRKMEMVEPGAALPGRSEPVPVPATHAVLGTPLPLSQSVLLVWPQITGLLALTLLLFTGAYVAFQRQEVRA